MFFVASETIPQRVLRWARDRPRSAALWNGDTQFISYSTLGESVEIIARSLNTLGFGRRDRIAIVLPNGAQLAIAWLGVTHAATAAPLNPTLNEEELVYEFESRRIDTVLTGGGSNGPAARAAERCSVPVIELQWENLERHPKLVLIAPQKGKAKKREYALPDDIGFVLTPSGTTSAKKVVPVKHRAFASSAGAVHRHYALREEDRCIALNPLYLMSGLHHLAAVLDSGGSIILLPRFDCRDFIEIYERLLPTWFHGSFAFLPTIIDYIRINGIKVTHGQFRFMHPSAGKISATVAQACEEIFGAPVIEMYCSTETCLIAANPLPPELRKRGTVGKPSNCEVAIFREDGSGASMGDIGEICVRGPSVFDGYESEENTATFVNGWYRTGDLGVFDADGFLTLCGRIKEMINRGGEKISPAEIDSVLLDHPEISDAATFGVPHKSLGEIVAAAVVKVPASKLSKAEIISYLAARRSAHKVPRVVIFVDSIPRGPTGKIKRIELAEYFERSKSFCST